MTVASFIGWQDEERRKTFVALAISILFHLLLILGVTFLLTRAIFIREPEPVDEEPIEFTIVAPPEAPPERTQYIQTSEEQRAEKPPDKPAFESDKDTLAASPLPASGDLPVPSQEGIDNQSLDFENRQSTLGPQPRPSTPVQAAQPAQQNPPPAPAATPQPKPEPQITPRQTTQLALLDPPKPKNKPQPETPRQTEPKTQPTTKPAQQAQPAQQSQPPGYQPQTRITRIRGNLTNRGRSSVAANATPLGRYNKMVSDAIGSRWYYYVHQQMSVLVPGTVEIRFTVSTDGKVSKVKVLRNSSNESFASCSVGSIVDAEIPPIPPEIVPMLEAGRLEIDFTFAIY